MPMRPHSSVRPGRPPVPAVHLARDHPDEVVRDLLRSGAWERIGRGVYLPTNELPGPERRREVALGRIAGVHRRLRTDHWFSHESAALIWGLALWSSPDTTHLYQPHRAGAHADPLVTHHVGVPADAERCMVSGLPVTSLERTIVDCAVTLPPLRTLVLADSAARLPADVDTVDRLLAARTGRRGSARARAILALADAGAESPGESAARFVVLRDGLPVPDTQISIETRLGTFWADLGWEGWRLLLEYDGRTKYVGRELERFMEEKRRHDAVLETGRRILRVTKEDLSGSILTRRILEQAPGAVAAQLRPRRELMTPPSARS
ncbi:hypothetical protein [Cellulomonas sp. ICMP 17802]|uniref:hypothetical protein n=1 Tax=Cellulomonas sp. ICMP 17802 TaxID=3239199 RepID=UPI00351ADAF7